MVIKGEYMGTRIEVMSREEFTSDSDGLILQQPIKVYNIDDSFTNEEIVAIEELLADPVVDVFSTDSPLLKPARNEAVIEKSPRPGVNDPEGKEARNAIQKVLDREIGPVSFSEQYLWGGELNETDYILLQKQIGNPLINDFLKIDSSEWTSNGIGFHFPVVDLPEIPAFEYVDINISSGKLRELSNAMMLELNSEEFSKIKGLYDGSYDPDFIARREKAGLKAIPTDAELQAFGQSWSEHCIHKKLKAIWKYTSEDSNDESQLPPVVDNVFKTMIQETTQKIAKGIDWLVSVLEDNAGAIKLNDRINISHKVETHNFPTALDAFGGSNTGVGGILRDLISVGKGMIVRLSQYGFRVAHPNYYNDLPLDIQTPTRTLEGMVDGVEDYGNKMGIPTSCGNVMVDPGWLKCVCYVGGLATVEAEINGRKTHTKDIRPGYVAVSLGGKVGKDGIHGATASSTDIKADAEERKDVSQAVQIGDPIVEKGVFEVMNLLQQLDLVEATQDCGAGGWNSAVGELTELLNDLEQKRYELQNVFEEKGITLESSYDDRLKAASDVIDVNRIASLFIDQIKSEIKSGEIFSTKTNGKGGIKMDLTHVPEKYKGLTGWEKLVSEAQEREVLVIKPENMNRVIEICEQNNVDLTVMGDFNNSGDYHVLDQDTPIAYLPIEFIGTELPQMTIEAHWKPCEFKEPELPVLEDLTDVALEMIGRPNLQTYDWIVTRFDHEVQGGSRIKPLVGLGKGKNDVVASRPEPEHSEIVIETWGSNPWQGDIDAYHMGVNNVVDAVGKVISAGGKLPDKDTYKLTFNGNITCPKPEEDPHIAAQVIRMLKGSADAELAFGTPRISGKDSTSVQRDYISTKTGKKVTVKAKPELLMSAMAVMPDDSTLTTSDFKLPGDLIYVVGDTRDELGGSEFYLMQRETGRNVPKSNLEEIKPRYSSLSEATESQLVHSVRYLTKGGLAEGLINSAMSGDIGFDADLSSLDEGLGRADKILFSETTGRSVVTIHPTQQAEFEKQMEGNYIRKIGIVGLDNQMNVKYNGKTVFSTTVEVAREANKGEIQN
ncbi:hypothetical protein CEE44_01710 [Candidatus Woesearchaeota archaeon B3_Woes]|nr:MAG: hypothetical protein CEE44_01710 [Candidatus Woesearchaeota archaeon B3_Woes]